MTERLPRHAMAHLGESESNGPSPERLRPKFGMLTISGRSGTGKTAVSEILAAKYGIPPENYTSQAVMEALGTVLTNKYSEGYPRKRYYQGNKVVDQVELLAQERAKKLFGVPYVNVQALSGSPANLAVYVALLEPLKDKIMGLSLAFGGHLTHGQPQSATGKFFQSVLYTLGEDAMLDFDAIEELAMKEKPKIIVCGFTAYPRTIDFKRFGEIADKAGAYLLADVSHIAGLIVGGAHPSPAPYVDIITTTTAQQEPI